jgi:hypothetical protein
MQGSSTVDRQLSSWSAAHSAPPDAPGIFAQTTLNY